MPGFHDLHLPGTIAPAELDGRYEWVPAGSGLVRSLGVRLGSETSPEKILLAALPPLAQHLAPDTWDALLEDLPWGLRRMMLSAGAHLGGPVPRLSTPEEYVRFVGRHTQHPDTRAAFYVSSVMGALKETGSPALADAIGAELPPGLAALWRDAS
jgi:uncharacterized protein (DUF2267 family)